MEQLKEKIKDLRAEIEGIYVKTPDEFRVDGVITHYKLVLSPSLGIKAPSNKQGDIEFGYLITAGEPRLFIGDGSRWDSREDTNEDFMTLLYLMRDYTTLEKGFLPEFTVEVVSIFGEKDYCLYELTEKFIGYKFLEEARSYVRTSGFIPLADKVEEFFIGLGINTETWAEEYFKSIFQNQSPPINFFVVQEMKAIYSKICPIEEISKAARELYQKRDELDEQIKELSRRGNENETEK